jgi:putative sigma-54 modulation protein
MKKPSIHITSHNTELSAALREFIQLKISSLSRFGGDIVAAEVVLRGKSGSAHLFSVSARLAFPGRDVHGNASHSDLYGAINKLVARLARLSRKRKTRLAKLFRRPVQKRNRALGAIDRKTLSKGSTISLSRPLPQP